MEITKGIGMKNLFRLLFLLTVLLLPNFAKAAYDPTTGVWLSRDPLGEDGGVNLYGYVLNDPLNSIDPFGLVNLDLQNPTADAQSINDLKNLNPQGVYSVHAHGTPDGSTLIDNRNGSDDSNGTYLTPEDLLKIMEKNGYKGGPVILYSCDAGKGHNSFAKELAKLINNKVTAPDGLLVHRPDGTLEIHPSLPGKLDSPDYSKNGSWQTYGQ